MHDDVRTVDPHSLVSLHIEPHFGTTKLGNATGFMVEHENKYYLVTNKHVLTGKHTDSGELLHTMGAVPDNIKIWFHVDPLGRWEEYMMTIYKNDGSARWLEHQNENVDVVLLPVTPDADIRVYTLDLGLAYTDMKLSPSELVSIIGFPAGHASDGKFPIWKTGHLASDVDLAYAGKQMFLIDATTKGGMSGAPVLAKRVGGYRSSTDYLIGANAVRFLGVYSGRLNKKYDDNVGRVWKANTIFEILNK